MATKLISKKNLLPLLAEHGFDNSRIASAYESNDWMNNLNE